MDFHRPLVQKFQGQLIKFELNQELSKMLRAYCRREGVTMFMVMLSSFNVLLQYYSGQNDIVVGTDVANRDDSNIERIVGLFVNQLVLRTNLDGVSNFNEILNRTRAVTLDAYKHQSVPFAKLVEELKPERNQSYSPMFQVKFALRNTPARILDIPGLEFVTDEPETGTSKLDIHMDALDSGVSIDMTMQYDTALFLPKTIEIMIKQFISILNLVVTYETVTQLQIVNLMKEIDSSFLQLQESEITENKKNMLRNFKRKPL
jgi:non-ribosomal peptide synthetase component F